MTSTVDSTYTLTFGDVAENHAKMQQIGTLADRGFTLEDLTRVKEWFEEKGVECELHSLRKECVPVEAGEAYVLVMRKGLSALVSGRGLTADDVFAEQKGLSDKMDKKAWMHGRVVNKKARHNLCFGEEDQEPDYENKKGTIVAFANVPILAYMREMWGEVMGPVGRNLMCEGNYYYDVKKCYIGYHGDTERRKVIGVRLGADFSLKYRWYHNCEAKTEKFELMLGHGDMYIMSDKAVGWDWKKRSQWTLRHAAGDDKHF